MMLLLLAFTVITAHTAVAELADKSTEPFDKKDAFEYMPPEQIKNTIYFDVKDMQQKEEPEPEKKPGSLKKEEDEETIQRLLGDQKPIPLKEKKPESWNEWDRLVRIIDDTPKIVVNRKVVNCHSPTLIPESNSPIPFISHHRVFLFRPAPFIAQKLQIPLNKVDGKLTKVEETKKRSVFHSPHIVIFKSPIPPPLPPVTITEPLFEGIGGRIEGKIEETKEPTFWKDIVKEVNITSTVQKLAERPTVETAKAIKPAVAEIKSLKTKKQVVSLKPKIVYDKEANPVAKTFGMEKPKFIYDREDMPVPKNLAGEKPNPKFIYVKTDFPVKIIGGEKISPKIIYVKSDGSHSISTATPSKSNIIEKIDSKVTYIKEELSNKEELPEKLPTVKVFGSEKIKPKIIYLKEDLPITKTIISEKVEEAKEMVKKPLEEDGNELSTYSDEDPYGDLFTDIFYE